MANSISNRAPEKIGSRASENSSLQLAYQWWTTIDQTDRQRVWDARHGFLAGDLVESMAKAGVPVVSDGRWSCVSVGPTGFTVPIAVERLLQRLSEVSDGEDDPRRNE